MFENFPSWWTALTGVEKVFWVLAGPFTVLFLIEMVLTFVSGDLKNGSSNGSGIKANERIRFRFFSTKNVIAFFTVFSWAGIAGLDSGLSVSLTLTISSSAGLIMMLVMGSTFYFLSKLTRNDSLKIINATAGGVGEVYTPVRAKRGNIGKVSIVVQGSLRELDAITDETEDLLPGMVISVKDVINENLLLVSKNR